MSSHRRLPALAALIVVAAARTHGAAPAPSITLSQYTYQTVKAAPFNGPLALYAPDIVSSNNQVKLPLAVHVLIGNGRRPFATDTGSMKPQAFSAYVSRLTASKMVRAIPFRIGKKGDALTFEYLSRQYILTVTDLVPCSGCDDRVILRLEPK
jgi:hypothetical protein